MTCLRAEVEQKTIQQDGLSLNLTIVRPIGVQQKAPAFLFFHGGGFMLGDLEELWAGVQS
jgi:acetyl esterase